MTLERHGVEFHDLQHEYLLLHAPTLTVLHEHLLDTYRSLLPAGDRDEWWRIPPDEPYIRDHLVDHLRGAGARDELTTTVTDVAYRWGFGHVPRFAAAYRERYGAHPRIPCAANLLREPDRRRA